MAARAGAAEVTGRGLQLVHESGLVEDVPAVDDPEVRLREWLETVADDDILVCRGRGPRHGFDPLVRRRKNRPLKHTWAFPVDDEPGEPEDRARIVQRCPDCRLVWRELVTAGGGEIPEPAKWRMWRDPRYSPPKGTGRVRAYAARRESSRRMKEDGTIAELIAERKPRSVLEFVEASDLRAADAAVRKGLHQR